MLEEQDKNTEKKFNTVEITVQGKLFIAHDLDEVDFILEHFKPWGKEKDRKV